MASRSAPAALLTVDEAKLTGMKLREVNNALLRQPEKGHARWWVSPERYVEVSVVCDGGGIAYVEVGVRGRLARYVRDRGVTTSVTDEMTISTPPPASRLESQQTTADQDVLDVVKAMLSASTEPLLRDAAEHFAQAH